MELRDLRYFCTVAEFEHVTKAAQHLNIAQPYLSRVIHQLEEEVGGPLFEKNTRYIRLNSEGRAYYKHAKKILSEVDSLYSEMNYLFEKENQTITLIANTESFSTKIILEFNKLDPDYSISVLQVKTRDIIQMLLNGEAQFALSSPPLPTGTYSSIIDTIEIFHATGCVLLPPNHPLLEKASVNIEDIRHEKLITMPKGSGMRNRLQPIFDNYNYHPKIVCESDNLNVITQAVQNGIGLAFITDVIISEYPELRENVRKLDLPDVIGYYGLSYNKNNISNENEAHFRKFIVNFFKSLSESIAELNDEMFRH